MEVEFNRRFNTLFPLIKLLRKLDVIGVDIHSADNQTLQERFLCKGLHL